MGYTKDNILQLLRRIDWMMGLPKNLEQVFDNELMSYERAETMPYITSVERVGMLKAHRECLILVLETRFGEVLPKFVEMINNLYDRPILKELFKHSLTIKSLEAFRQLLVQAIAEQSLEN